MGDPVPDTSSICFSFIHQNHDLSQCSTAQCKESGVTWYMLQPHRLWDARNMLMECEPWKQLDKLPFAYQKMLLSYSIKELCTRNCNQGKHKCLRMS